MTGVFLVVFGQRIFYKLVGYVVMSTLDNKCEFYLLNAGHGLLMNASALSFSHFRSSGRFFLLFFNFLFYIKLINNVDSFKWIAKGLIHVNTCIHNWRFVLNGFTCWKDFNPLNGVTLESKLKICINQGVLEKQNQFNGCMREVHIMKRNIYYMLGNCIKCFT